jgi:hypothetical protein
MNNLILKMGKGPKYTFLKIRCRNVKTGIWKLNIATH